MSETQFDWKDMLALLTPDGQRQIGEFIADFRTKHGPEWLEDFQAEYPTFAWIADLAANRTADEAVAEITRQYPLAVFAKTQITAFHAFLKQEIDKKR